ARPALLLGILCACCGRFETRALVCCAIACDGGVRLDVRYRLQQLLFVTCVRVLGNRLFLAGARLAHRVCNSMCRTDLSCAPIWSRLVFRDDYFCFSGEMVFGLETALPYSARYRACLCYAALFAELLFNGFQPAALFSERHRPADSVG